MSRLQFGLMMFLIQGALNMAGKTSTLDDKRMQPAAVPFRSSHPVRGSNAFHRGCRKPATTGWVRFARGFSAAPVTIAETLRL